VPHKKIPNNFLAQVVSKLQTKLIKLKSILLTCTSLNTSIYTMLYI
jgi:hypothetical protein